MLIRLWQMGRCPIIGPARTMAGLLWWVPPGLNLPSAVCGDEVDELAVHQSRHSARRQKCPPRPDVGPQQLWPESTSRSSDLAEYRCNRHRWLDASDFQGPAAGQGSINPAPGLANGRQRRRGSSESEPWEADSGQSFGRTPSRSSSLCSGTLADPRQDVPNAASQTHPLTKPALMLPGGDGPLKDNTHLLVQEREREKNNNSQTKQSES